jgi:hypothetical protein
MPLRFAVALTFAAHIFAVVSMATGPTSAITSHIARRGGTKRGIVKSHPKHYSNQRLMDWAYTGATGNNVGVFMIRSNHEGDSGDPFYRCLINQAGVDQEIYEIINYGEAQREPFRTGVLNGPYILAFTDGPPPDTNIDTSWRSR